MTVGFLGIDDNTVLNGEFYFCHGVSDNDALAIVTVAVEMHCFCRCQTDMVAMLKMLVDK